MHEHRQGSKQSEDEAAAMGCRQADGPPGGGAEAERPLPDRGPGSHCGHRPGLGRLPPLGDPQPLPDREARRTAVLARGRLLPGDRDRPHRVGPGLPGHPAGLPPSHAVPPPRSPRRPRRPVRPDHAHADRPRALIPGGRPGGPHHLVVGRPPGVPQHAGGPAHRRPARADRPQPRGHARGGPCAARRSRRPALGPE